MSSHIQRILVWPGKLRLAHGLIAFGTLGLIATGFLIRHAPSVAEAASRYHGMLAALLTAGLLIRIWLLFTDETTANWQALSPNRIQTSALLDMLRFYLSFGRSPLPAWYAHNPLWIPLYGITLLLLTILILTGYLMPSQPLLFTRIYLPDLHRATANLILIFTAAHIVASILHDLKGSGSDLSGIVNGHRIFLIEKKPAQPISTVKFFTPDKISDTKPPAD